MPDRPRGRAVMDPVTWVMLPWLLQVTPTAAGELPPPAALIVNSSSLSHVLSWQPGAETPSGVYYSVSMMTDRETSWSPVVGCEHVLRPLVCSLTEAIHNPRELHFVRVEAKLAAHTSKPTVLPGFIPHSDIHLDPPVLTVTTCGADLCVDLHPPVEDQRQLYNHLHYRLKIENSRADTATISDVHSLTPQVLRHLAPDRRYCISVCIHDFLGDQESSYSRPVCVVTPSTPTAHHWLLPVSFLLVLPLLLLMLLVRTGFICLRRAPPVVLSSICHVEVLVLSPRSSSLVPLVVLKPSSPSLSDQISKCSSDDSDSDSDTEAESLSVGRTYKDGLNSNRLSSCSESLSGPQSNTSSNQNPLFGQTEPTAEIQPTVNSHSGLDFLDTHSSNVDLLTLTCASHCYQEEEEEGEEEEEELLLHLTNDWTTSECSTNSISFQRREMSDLTFSAAETEEDVEEEEEDEEEGQESSGYLKHPQPHMH